MKAIRLHAFGGTDVLTYEAAADPVAAAGQAVVLLKAIGVNPVDTYIRGGTYGPRDFPFILGFDAAGVVESVGPGVTAYHPGDRVYVHSGGSGTYAERVVAPVSFLQPLPPTLTFQQGAAIGVPYATAYAALFSRAQSKPGEWVLIHGASGGVGTAAVQLARAAGLQVIGTGGTEKGRALVLQNGAHHVIDHHAPDALEQAVALTGGKGVDVIIEMFANINLGNDLKALGPHGRVVVVGTRGRVEIDPRELMKKHSDIRGMSLITIPPLEVERIHQALQPGFEKGSLRPVVGQEIPLRDAARAHDAVLASGAHGKIVMIP